MKLSELVTELENSNIPHDEWKKSSNGYFEFMQTERSCSGGIFQTRQYIHIKTDKGTESLYWLRKIKDCVETSARDLERIGFEDDLTGFGKIKNSKGGFWGDNSIQKIGATIEEQTQTFDYSKEEKESEVKTKLEPYKEAEEDIELARKWKELKDNKLLEERLKGASIKQEVLMPLAPPTREEYVLCRCKECGYEYSIRQDRVNGKWKGVCQFCEKKQKETSPQELMQKAQEVVEEAKKHDAVNHPKHYTQGKIECIEALESATINKRGIEAVCTANIIKYLWRYESKNGIEDVKKAQWYLQKLISELEKQQKE